METNSTYFMANFINNNTKASANLYLGMCLPAMCSNETIKAALNKELVKNKLLIQSMVGMPLAVGVVDTNPQDYTYEKSGWFYFTVVTIVILVILGIVSLVRFRKRKEKYSGVAKILQSFDFSESMKIFTYKSNYLNVFNGIKTICMFWVIWGHQFSVRLKFDVNISGIPGQVEKFFYLFVTGAFLAVDVFFFIGGFLVAYSFMREKSKSILKYPMAIVHRVLRFWPSYIMTILVYYSVYIHTGSGPLWKENMTLGQIPYCSSAWKTLLFVDNLVGNG
jgi:branched-subunit amino acid transport protein